MNPYLRPGAWEEITAEKMRFELEKFRGEHNDLFLSNAQISNAKVLAQAQMQPQPLRRSLGDINPTLAEINSPDSPMALSIPTMLVLWKQRHGYKWVSEEEVVKDEYWAVVARRLHGLHMLERMEATLGSTWDRTAVFRLKDDENGY